MSVYAVREYKFKWDFFF